MNLTDTQKTILEAAVTRPDGDINPLPERIKGGAAIKVITALEKKGLIFDASLNPPYRNWRISDEGYRAIGLEPPATDSKEEPDTETKPARKTRAGTKQARIIEMMKRPEGTTIEQISHATGWNANSTRGFISGTLRKRLGLNIIKQRVSHVGPNAQGSYTTYRIEE